MRNGTLTALSLVLLLGVGAFAREPGAKPVSPRYAADGRLERPADYRDWVYLSSGLGMTYNPGGSDHEPLFTNVFVTPAAYREFTATGKWPEKAMFVVEERSSSSRGSINQGGRFQADLMGLAVEVKDSSRFPEQWGYFTFDAASTSGKLAAKDRCWQCHDEHAAVEHSFVQFYPTLQPIARKFGAYREPR